MDKLKLAHEFAMKLISVGATNKTEDIIRLGWEYADAMQKEADEREPKGLPQALSPEVTQLNNTLAAQKMVHGSDEWQPDWSQAPDSACCWFVGGISRNRKAYWSEYIPCYKNDETQVTWGCRGMTEAPMFGYDGKWQDSLRKRP